MINRWLTYTLSPFQGGNLIRRFRLVLYAILLWQALFMWLDYPEQLGQYAVSPISYPRGNFISWYGHLFSFPSMAWARPILLALHILALVVGLMGKWPRVISVLVFLTAANLFTLKSNELTGGENLASIMLFMLMFVYERPKSTFAHAWMNTLLLAMQLQLCLLYLISGLNKLPDPAWLNGDAFSISLNTIHYSTEWVPSFLKESNWMTATMTWVALTYQLTFWILVWIRPIRGYLFAVGLGFHVGIMILMGLPTFSLAMMASYLLFPTSHVGIRVWPLKKKKSQLEESPVEQGAALHQ